MLHHSTPQDKPIPDASGIYQITCIPTGKFYIGSAVNLRNRWRHHFNELRRNSHKNSKLQHAWNKYGETTFIFEIVEFVLPPFLLEREQFWFDTLSPFDERGFNLYRIAGSPYGREVSQVTRDKIGAAHRGRPSPKRGSKSSPETCAKISAAQVGRVIPPEHRKKLSQANLGKKFSPESIAKRTQSRIGFTHTPETREKLRQANIGKGLGRKLSPEHVEKMRQSQLGKKVSPEALAKNIARNEAYMKTLVITAPDGTESVVTGIRKFCREHSLHIGHLMDVANGKQRQHKGWKARFPTSD